MGIRHAMCDDCAFQSHHWSALRHCLGYMWVDTEQTICEDSAKISNIIKSTFCEKLSERYFIFAHLEGHKCREMLRYDAAGV